MLHIEFDKYLRDSRITDVTTNHTYYVQVMRHITEFLTHYLCLVRVGLSVLDLSFTIKTEIHKILPTINIYCLATRTGLDYTGLSVCSHSYLGILIYAWGLVGQIIPLLHAREQLHSSSRSCCSYLY